MIKKEYLIVTTLALFFLAYLLDNFAGPVTIVINNPLIFLSPKYLSYYPFTAVAILVRTAALFLSTLLVLSTVEKKYFLKSLILLCLGVLLQLYAIQQLATNAKVTPVQWTLSFAYTGITFILPLFCFILWGSIEELHKSLTQSSRSETKNSEETEETL